jgi:hypothetical protein
MVSERPPVTRSAVFFASAPGTDAPLPLFSTHWSDGLGEEFHMGNENERKHDPAENRQNQMGGGPDDAKTGGDESNVGLRNDVGGGARGMGVGSAGVIGGSADFLTDTDATAENQPTSGQQSQQNEFGERQVGQGHRTFGAAENMTGQSGQIGGDSSFGGQSGSGTSAIAGNSGQSDLGSAGIGSGGGQSSSGEATTGSGDSGTDTGDDIGPGGQSEIGGASDLGGGETGLGSGFVSSQDDSSGDYLQQGSDSGSDMDDASGGGDFARDGQGALDDDGSSRAGAA